MRFKVARLELKGEVKLELAPPHVQLFREVYRLAKEGCADAHEQQLLKTYQDFFHDRKNQE